jgi:hypothetical protein
MKLMLEFDLAMQPAELTLSQLTAKINAFVVEHEINSLQIHEVRRTKSRRLDEAFLTWGVGELGEEHVAELMAILASQFGLVGYTNPIPSPLVMAGGANPTAGLIVAATLPVGGDVSGVIVSVGESRGGGSYGASGLVKNVGAGNVYEFIQALVTGAYPLAIQIENWSSSPFTFPAIPTAYTVKDTTPTTQQLKLANNLTIPASVPWGGSVLAAYKGLYLAQTGDLYQGYQYGAYQQSIFYTFDEAAQFPAL